MGFDNKLGLSCAKLRATLDLPCFNQNLDNHDIVYICQLFHCCNFCQFLGGLVWLGRIVWVDLFWLLWFGLISLVWSVWFDWFGWFDRFSLMSLIWIVWLVWFGGFGL